jgi:hypothetical protein
VRSNPFATRFISPGEIPWFDVRGNKLSADLHFSELARRWEEEFGFQATIIGPHGSGKSTLLSHLAATCLRQTTSNVVSEVIEVQLRASERPVSQWRVARRRYGPGKVLMVDGLEQLPGWYRVWAIVHARYHRIRLLATAHRRSGLLPVLFETNMNPCLASQIVRHLIQGVPADWGDELSDRHRLQELLSRHAGNLREVLMDLYDHYEKLAEEPEAYPPVIA